MSAPPLYPDPRGELELRREIAAYLALSRRIECTRRELGHADSDRLDFSRAVLSGVYGSGGLRAYVPVCM